MPKRSEGGELNPKAWEDINQAVGDAMGVKPPDPKEDRVEGAPPQGSSGAKLVQGTGYDPLAQGKSEDNGVRYQMVQATDLAVEHQRYLEAQVEEQNRIALSRAIALFHRDGSLLGEYAPIQGQSVTPDTVDALWWLSLPRAQAMWELGLDADDDKTYSRVRRDIEAMAAIVINRMLQTREVVPMVIRRKRRRFNLPLFAGGRIHRLKPILPEMLPPPGTPRRRTPK